MEPEEGDYTHEKSYNHTRPYIGKKKFYIITQDIEPFIYISNNINKIKEFILDHFKHVNNFLTDDQCEYILDLCWDNIYKKTICYERPKLYPNINIHVRKLNTIYSNYNFSPTSEKIYLNELTPLEILSK